MSLGPRFVVGETTDRTAIWDLESPGPPVAEFSRGPVGELEAHARLKVLQTAPGGPDALRREQLAGWLGIVAGVLIVVGSFLPWVTATAPLVGSMSRSGVDGGGDGLITVVCGLAILAVSVARLLNWPLHKAIETVPLFAGVVSLLVAVVGLIDVNSRVKEVSSETGMVAAGSGVGIWAVLLGSVGACVVGFWFSDWGPIVEWRDRLSRRNGGKQQPRAGVGGWTVLPLLGVTISRNTAMWVAVAVGGLGLVVIVAVLSTGDSNEPTRAERAPSVATAPAARAPSVANGESDAGPYAGESRTEAPIVHAACDDLMPILDDLDDVRRDAAADVGAWQTYRARALELHAPAERITEEAEAAASQITDIATYMVEHGGATVLKGSMSTLGSLVEHATSGPAFVRHLEFSLMVPRGVCAEWPPRG